MAGFRKRTIALMRLLFSGAPASPMSHFALLWTLSRNEGLGAISTGLSPAPKR